MMKISLAAYTVRLQKREPKDKKNYYWNDCILSKFNDADDFLNVSMEFLGQLDHSKINNQYNHYVKTERIEVDGRKIFGLLESGLFGEPANLVNIETNKIQYTKKINEAETQPFYFRFSVQDKKLEKEDRVGFHQN